MKSLRKILSLALLGLYLVPAVGFYYVRHVCNETGDITFTLSEDFICCAEESDSHRSQHLEITATAEEQNSCCDLKHESDELLGKHHQDCCTNQINYHKVNKEYVISNSKYTSDIETIKEIILINLTSESGNSIHIAKDSGPPPYPPPGRILLSQFCISRT